MSRLKFLSRFDADVATPPRINKLIDDGLNSSNWDVRQTAAQHPNLTKEHLDRALSDSDPWVRRAAATHPNLTKEQLSRALADRNEYVWVRDVATTNPRYKEFYPTGHPNKA